MSVCLSVNLLTRTLNVSIICLKCSNFELLDICPTEEIILNLIKHILHQQKPLNPIKQKMNLCYCLTTDRDTSLSFLLHERLAS